MNHEPHEKHEKGVVHEESHAIQGAVFDVCQECMKRELTLRGIPFQSQKELALSYKGQGLT